jgi:simple sugar transport system permease protein
MFAGLAALPRVTLGTNEIITTLMLNFVALHLMNYLVFGSFSPWRDPASTNFPQGRPLSAAASLPEVWRRVDLGLPLAVVVAATVWWALRSTRWGYEVRIAGDSPGTARYAGIAVTRKVLGVFLLSGAIAGLAGAVLVAGVVGSLEPRALAVNLGFTGIIVASLARLNPVAVIPVAVLMGALNNAGPALQTIRVPSATVLMVQGLILVFAVSGSFLLQHRVRLRREVGAAGVVDA